MLEPIFPKATELLFHTGNTLTLFKVLKRTNSSISDEVIHLFKNKNSGLIAFFFIYMNSSLNTCQWY